VKHNLLLVLIDIVCITIGTVNKYTNLAPALGNRAANDAVENQTKVDLQFAGLSGDDDVAIAGREDQGQAVAAAHGADAPLAAAVPDLERLAAGRRHGDVVGAEGQGPHVAAMAWCRDARQQRRCRSVQCLLGGRRFLGLHLHE